MNNYWIKEKAYPSYRLLYSNCDSEFSEQEKIKLLNDLNDGLPEYNVFQYFNSQPTIFNDYTHLVIAKENRTDKTIGLLGTKSFDAEDFDFLYFWTAMVTESHQRSILLPHIYAWLFYNICKYDKFYSVLATKTYNPNVYNIFVKNKRVLGDKVKIYPQIEEENAKSMKLYANKIIDRLCPDLTFDINTGCVYGGQSVLAPNFFPYMPQCKNKFIHNYWEKTLTPDDQILCIAYIPQELESNFIKFLEMI